MRTRLPTLRILIGALGAAVGFAVLVWARDLVALAVVGAVLAYLLSPVVDRLESRGLSRAVAAALVFFGLVGLIVAAVYLTLPLVAAQIETFQTRWGDGRLYVFLDQLEGGLATWLPFVEPGSLGLAASAEAALAAQSERWVERASGALSFLGNAVVLPFVLFFLLRDGLALQRRLLALVPNRYFEFAMNMRYQVDAHLGGYLRGQALVAVIVGVLTTVGLAIVGVDYYFLLGALAGLSNLIPYAGLIITATATLAVSLLATGGLQQVPGILVVFAVVQVLENVVLQPWITARNVSLHPVTVLVAILLGGRLFGVLGMALAVPTAAIIKVVLYETLFNLRRYRL